jgi:hypothetical protein
MIATTTERLRVLENDQSGGMITAQLHGSQSCLGLRIISGYLDCNPGEIWAIEYDAEAVGDDPRGLLWLVDAKLEKVARVSKAAINRQFQGIQLELFAA